MGQEKKWESILFSEIHWPQIGDKPFTQSAKLRQNAEINQFGHFRLEYMIDGYKKGADLMVERALKERTERDILIFPIVFCYRHFIELSFKYLINTYGNVVGIESKWNTHNLSELWKTVKNVLKKYMAPDVDGVESIVDKIIAEFEKIDQRSFSFRYPVNTGGQIIEFDREKFDLVNLAKVMNRLEGFFDGCDGYLDDLKSSYCD